MNEEKKCLQGEISVFVAVLWGMIGALGQLPPIMIAALMLCVFVIVRGFLRILGR